MIGSICQQFNSKGSTQHQPMLGTQMSESQKKKILRQNRGHREIPIHFYCKYNYLCIGFGGIDKRSSLTVFYEYRKCNEIVGSVELILIWFVFI